MINNGTFLTTQTTRAFLTEMLKANSGHIVTVGSVAGLLGTYGCTDYSATKFACVGFHEALFTELKVRAIEVYHDPATENIFLSFCLLSDPRLRWHQYDARLPLLHQHWHVCWLQASSAADAGTSICCRQHGALDTEERGDLHATGSRANVSAAQVFATGQDVLGADVPRDEGPRNDDGFPRPRQSDGWLGSWPDVASESHSIVFSFLSFIHFNTS